MPEHEHTLHAKPRLPDWVRSWDDAYRAVKAEKGEPMPEDTKQQLPPRGVCPGCGRDIPAQGAISTVTEPKRFAGNWHPRCVTAYSIAEHFHDAYERHAPSVGYRTRKASAVEWNDVPAKNRHTMVRTVVTLLESGAIR